MVVSEANRDEALRCFQMSRKSFESGDLEVALKLAQKAVAMHETVESQAWLQELMNEAPRKKAEPASEEAKTAPDLSTASKGKNAKTADTAAAPAYTAEQVSQVKAFVKINKNDYYAVLGTPKTASDDDIKKAYRKLALQFHPDKNRAPGADDIFKAISRAFSCLGDASKRRQYDRFGAETPTPASRGGFGGGARAQGFPFSEAEIDPEEIFRMFFGQGGFGGGGGGSPFGSHFYSFGGGHPFFQAAQQEQRQQQRRQRTAEHRGPASDFDRIRSTVSQLLPIIIFFVFTIFSSWLGSFFDSKPRASMPTGWDDVADLVSLNPGLGFPYQRQTVSLHVPYYATRHFQDSFTTEAKHRQRLKAFEDVIEKCYVKELQRQCRAETAELEAKIKTTKDRNEQARLKKQSRPSCDRLHSLGVRQT